MDNTGSLPQQGVIMERTFIQVLGLAGTVEIMKYLKEHETASYKDLIQFGSVSTLNRRLRQLSDFGLIEHHLQKKDRKEWYLITEKGKKVLKLIGKLQKAVEE